MDKDVTAYQTVVNNLKEQEKDLENRLANLTNQIQDAQVRHEQEVKLGKSETLKKTQEEEKMLKQKNELLKSRTVHVEELENGLRTRQSLLEKREIEVQDFDSQIMKLREERDRFNKYKYDTELSLDRAKITIAEADTAWDKVIVEREEVEGREKNAKQLELDWNTRLGEVEAREKQVKILSENLPKPAVVKKEELTHV